MDTTSTNWNRPLRTEPAHTAFDRNVLIVVRLRSSVEPSRLPETGPLSYVRAVDSSCWYSVEDLSTSSYSIPLEMTTARMLGMVGLMDGPPISRLTDVADGLVSDRFKRSSRGKFT